MAKYRWIEKIKSGISQVEVDTEFEAEFAEDEKIPAGAKLVKDNKAKVKPAEVLPVEETPAE